MQKTDSINSDEGKYVGKQGKEGEFVH